MQYCTSIAANLKNKGYLFAARYYSTSQWKVLSTAESAKIAEAGLKRISIFQNASNSDGYFTKSQASADASTAISLAKSRGQSSGSAIYFAVDYDATKQAIENNIKNYFSEIHSTLSNVGYTVGIYGSGRACEFIKGAGLAEYTWLAMSENWEGSATYSDWDIKQLRSTTISGIEIDNDRAKHIAGIGGW